MTEREALQAAVEELRDVKATNQKLLRALAHFTAAGGSERG